MLTAFSSYVQKLGSKEQAGSYPWLAEAIQNGNVFIASDVDKIVGVVTTTLADNNLTIGQLGIDPCRERGSAVG